MEYKVFKGKLGNETWICDITKENCSAFDPITHDLNWCPAKGELLSLGGEIDNVVYRVIDVLLDYAKYDGDTTKPNISLFVQEYDWE